MTNNTLEHEATNGTKRCSKFVRRSVIFVASCLIFSSFPQMTVAEELKFKDDFLARLVKDVPKILKTQDKSTGRFGSGVFIVTDQNVLFPLAAAYATKRDGVENPYYHNPELLDAVMAGGDALIA